MSWTEASHEEKKSENRLELELENIKNSIFRKLKINIKITHNLN
jgi:hypothetical protein